MIAQKTGSNERQQAPRSSVDFKDETYNNGDLRNEGLKDFHLRSVGASAFAKPP